jgi:NAD(P)-dependent dehydrogenase (short-subunit alcohol dehydrogenase family)
MLPGIKQFDLHGRSAIVTGGTKGLGRGMAEGLASAGSNVAVVGRTLSDVEQVAAEIARDYRVQAVGLAGDVGQPESIATTIANAVEFLGKVDILINNAGVNIRGPIDELSYEQFRQVQQTNVDGVWLTTQAVIGHMKQRGGGRIINISSTLGVVGLANRTPYAASKGAVSLMTKAMALEFAPFGITCNAICPGPFLTEMNLPVADSEQVKRDILGATALGRWGRLEEIQGAAIFLASDAASYVTGSLLMVDGGWTAR